MSADALRPYRVLLIEDNPADARLVRLAIEEGPALVDLSIAGDGTEAWSLLNYANPDSARPGQAQARPATSPPDLILMDLNLPRRGGHELLSDMAGDERMRLIPVVIFSSSASADDIRRSYSLGACAYVTKPSDLDHFFSVVHRIEQFWLLTARLPGVESAV